MSEGVPYNAAHENHNYHQLIQHSNALELKALQEALLPQEEEIRCLFAAIAA